MAREYGPKGLAIVAPSLDAEATVLKYRKASKATYPMMADCDALAKRYMVPGYPYTYLIGKDSKILWKDNHPDQEMEKLLVAALAAEAPVEKKAPVTVYVLKDGRRIVVVTKMEAAGQLMLKDDTGKMITVEPADVVEILKDVPAETAAQPAASPGESKAEPAKPAEAKPAEPAKPTAENANPATPPGVPPAAKPSKYPVLVLKDGRRIAVVMKMEAGDELTIKDDNGQMQSVKKADIVETIPAGK